MLNDEGSHQQDSFNPALDGLLDCAHYTRPEVWTTPGAELRVPEVLMSGNHERIARHRREQSLQTTAALRPELLSRAREQGRLSKHDEAFLRSLPPGKE